MVTGAKAGAFRWLTEPFRARHPTAFKKWQEAEELLWKDDSPRSFTLIGHLCGEAMQEFSASILRHEDIPALELDKSKTVDRIGRDVRNLHIDPLAWHVHTSRVTNAVHIELSWPT
jgi:hypothetical protein